MKPDPRRSRDALRKLADAASDSQRLRAEIERAQARERQPTLRDPTRRAPRPQR